MKQNEKVVFRLKNEQKMFINDFAQKMGMDLSEFLRMIIEYFFLAYFSKQPSYNEMRRIFFEAYPRAKKHEDTKTEV